MHARLETWTEAQHRICQEQECILKVNVFTEAIVPNLLQFQVHVPSDVSTRSAMKSASPKGVTSMSECKWICAPLEHLLIQSAPGTPNKVSSSGPGFVNVL